jgi:L-ribulokinase
MSGSNRLVAGVDFGTLSVRVSIFDSKRGRLGSGVGEYPLHRKPDDPDHATQSHSDHMRALAEATQAAVANAGVQGDAIEALAVDTTGSSVVPVDANLEPLDDYYLWCDHRAWKEAGEITAAAHAQRVPAIEWCGGTYSSEWGFAKMLHWMRHNPAKRARMATALEHCDMAAAVLCGIRDPQAVPRSVCAMGHKWMWNASLGGLPAEEYLTSLDPVFAGVRAKIGGRYATSDRIAGKLAPEWAEKLGLRAGIPTW